MGANSHAWDGGSVPRKQRRDSDSAPSNRAPPPPSPHQITHPDARMKSRRAWGTCTSSATPATPPTTPSTAPAWCAALAAYVAATGGAPAQGPRAMVGEGGVAFRPGTPCRVAEMGGGGKGRGSPTPAPRTQPENRRPLQRSVSSHLQRDQNAGWVSQETSPQPFSRPGQSIVAPASSEQALRTAGTSRAALRRP